MFGNIIGEINASSEFGQNERGTHTTGISTQCDVSLQVRDAIVISIASLVSNTIHKLVYPIDKTFGTAWSGRLLEPGEETMIKGSTKYCHRKQVNVLFGQSTHGQILLAFPGIPETCHNDIVQGTSLGSGISVCHVVDVEYPFYEIGRDLKMEGIGVRVAVSC